MPQISFEQIYSDDKYQAYGVFLLWANDFLDGMDAPPTVLHHERVFSFLSSLRKEDFPANGGFDAASPFKKAANVYVWLHAINPFSDPLKADWMPADFSRSPQAIATLVGFSLVQSCLTGATINKTDGNQVVLANPIALSHHFFCDLMEASEGISPMNHFKVFSLLFEALAYEANPGVCYPKVF